jgi:hypothetical protein
MALPKIDVPIYEAKLLSTGKAIKFRPFTVKEEKLFLMATESEDTDTTINTIRQVLNNCVLDDIDIDSLPLFDIEFLFVNLRARSIGEVVNLKYRCKNMVMDEESKEEKVCNNQVQIDLNILEIKPEAGADHTKDIKITDTLGIMMRYPKMNMVFNSKDKDEFDVIVELIIDCIDYIYDADSVYYSKDSSREELMEFVDSLQSKDLDKIKQFFETMPKMKKNLDFKCSKCDYHESLELEGIQSFFG